MFEGKIYECNGTNGRQGVAIMVSNECKEKTKLVYKDNEGRFIEKN
jgi:exonuclease III